MNFIITIIIVVIIYHYRRHCRRGYSEPRSEVCCADVVKLMLQNVSQIIVLFSWNWTYVQGGPKSEATCLSVYIFKNPKWFLCDYWIWLKKVNW